jgi:hypothetical protein
MQNMHSKNITVSYEVMITKSTNYIMQLFCHAQFLAHTTLYITVLKFSRNKNL